MKAQRLIVIAGPTASGKTALGIELARRLGGAIISADSRMVYRGLDIGTGKPTWEHRTLKESPWIGPHSSEFGPVYPIDGIDHYGLDLAAPDTRFTLTDWLAVVRPLISHLTTRGIQPIMVGGTGLYLRALIKGFEPPPTDPALRAAIETRSDEELLDTLYEFDPVTAQRVAGNRRRLVRAVEVIELTGRPISQGRAPHALEAIVLAPQVDRTELYTRIDDRLQERLAAGLIDEVRGLIDEVTGVRARAERVDWLRSLGLEYRCIADWLTLPGLHLRGVIPEVSEIQGKLQGEIHRYARRQLTYLRHQLPVQWVRSTDEALAFIGAW
jgi:tRNA dimethylallyltransferase